MCAIMEQAGVRYPTAKAGGLYGVIQASLNLTSLRPERGYDTSEYIGTREWHLSSLLCGR
jgi:hypothetical protein